MFVWQYFASLLSWYFVVCGKWTRWSLKHHQEQDELHGSLRQFHWLVPVVISTVPLLQLHQKILALFCCLLLHPHHLLLLPHFVLLTNLSTCKGHPPPSLHWFHLPTISTIHGCSMAVDGVMYRALWMATKCIGSRIARVIRSHHFFRGKVRFPAIFLWLQKSEQITVMHKLNCA